MKIICKNLIIILLVIDSNKNLREEKITFEHDDNKHSNVNINNL